jgi:streptogramin lyase
MNISMARPAGLLVLLGALLLAGCGLSARAADPTGGAVNTPPPTPSTQVSGVTTTPTGAGIDDLQLTVAVHNPTGAAVAVRPDDFSLLTAEGDIFAQSAPPSPPSALSGSLKPGDSFSGRLTFQLPNAAVAQACLLLRLPALGLSTCERLTRATAAKPGADGDAAIVEYPLPDAAKMPWDLAVDPEGDVWFANPGCNFPLSCSESTPPGALGERLAGSGQVVVYTLPNVAGNQPLFLAFDAQGHLWFTTPNNSMIGEFDPATRRFVGQWPVISDSGPWDLTFVNGRIWFTENYISGIGEFDPVTHAFRDFATPTPNSSPYGIAARGGQVWFTENSGGVAQIGLLDTAHGDQVVEYPIRADESGTVTPHEIAVDAKGDPWWTEGTTRALATLDVAAATPGQCGASSGDCTGVSEYPLPAAPAACPSAHTSGIVVAPDQTIWLDDSLAAQVGHFDPATGQFTLYNLGNCNAHPHDGLVLDKGAHLWFGETFGGELGELVQG